MRHQEEHRAIAIGSSSSHSSHGFFVNEVRQGEASKGSMGDATVYVAPSGGQAAWEGLREIVCMDRPEFFTYLSDVARNSAELSAVQAPFRLEALACVQDTMSSVTDPAEMMGNLRHLFMEAPINNIGDYASGSHFVSEVFLSQLTKHTVSHHTSTSGSGRGAILGANCTLRDMEVHIYDTWARWGICGGKSGMFDENLLKSLIAFPPHYAGQTGIVHEWGLGFSFDLAEGK